MLPTAQLLAEVPQGSKYSTIRYLTNTMIAIPSPIYPTVRTLRRTYYGSIVSVRSSMVVYSRHEVITLRVQVPNYEANATNHSYHSY